MEWGLMLRTSAYTFMNNGSWAGKAEGDGCELLRHCFLEPGWRTVVRVCDLGEYAYFVIRANEEVRSVRQNNAEDPYGAL